VDFGTWIGPTVLFGAQLARRTFGIEGDPAAFAQVSANVKYNADAPWYPRVHLQPACVHVDDNSVHTMKSKNVGDSASSIGKVHGEQPGEVMPSWKVRCFTLAHFFKMWDINPEEEHVVVKIDVESYECDLIPSFFSWLQGMKTKPTLLLAMHSQITYCSQAQYADIAKVAKLFKFVTPGLVSADGKSISGHTGDYMLSDIIVHPHLNV
jgi:FkbM family methyltransferase